jgi:hypothetical protein
VLCYAVEIFDGGEETVESFCLGSSCVCFKKMALSPSGAWDSGENEGRLPLDVSGEGGDCCKRKRKQSRERDTAYRQRDDDGSTCWACCVADRLFGAGVRAGGWRRRRGYKDIDRACQVQRDLLYPTVGYLGKVGGRIIDQQKLRAVVGV